MKKKKLTLNNLKVESFVTSLKQNEAKTINGGAMNIKPGSGLFDGRSVGDSCTCVIEIGITGVINIY